MGFRNNARAKVWDVKRRSTKNGGEMVQLNITTSKKDKNGEKFVKDFSGFVTLAGKAKEKANEIGKDDVITLTEVEVTTNYVAAQGKQYTNFTVWDYEMYHKSETSEAETTDAFSDFDSDFGTEVPF